MAKIRKYLKRKLVLLSLLSFTSLSAQAGMSPLAISLFPPLQFPSMKSDVYGLRIGLLAASNEEMFGLDFGLIGNHVRTEFTGLSIAGGFHISSNATIILLQASGAVNYVKKRTFVLGLQFAGLFNYNRGQSNIIGMQIAGFANINRLKSSVTGLQAALFMNRADSTKVNGLQLGMINFAREINGLQAGIYNSAGTVTGIQFGLINRASSLYGIQIGLLNFHEMGTVGVLPILLVGL